MLGIPEGRSETETGEGDPTATPPFTLDGRDVLARACMAALMEGQRHIGTGGNDDDYDFSTAIFNALKSATEHNIGPHEPSPWICINLDDFRIGRAYPYKGEHRIVPIVPDNGFIQDLETHISPDEDVEE